MSQRNPLYNYHKPTKKIFLNEGQEGKTGPVWKWVPVGGHKERVKEGKYRSILYSHMGMEP
jgi:hypothetical protein